MLNQAFPSSMKTPSNDNYILDSKYHTSIIDQNTSTDSGMEIRVEPVFTYEIRKKLGLLEIAEWDFTDKIIMDVCGGSGFLTYHLLQRDIKPSKIVICDISSHELEQAKKLLEPIKGDTIIEYLCENIGTNKVASDSFDMVIGNSFLHHFYDVPDFLGSIHRILKPWAYFIWTHEPTTYAVAIESWCFPLYLYALIRGEKYIDDIRYKGKTIKSNNLGDVWVFDAPRLIKVFTQIHFKNPIITHSNIMKSFLTTNFGLSPIKIALTHSSRLRLSNIGFCIDLFLQKFLPDRFFWEVMFKVEK